jgi:hypothetical protein
MSCAGRGLARVREDARRKCGERRGEPPCSPLLGQQLGPVFCAIISALCVIANMGKCKEEERGSREGKGKGKVGGLH